MSKLKGEQVDAIVAAMLAVNSYPLARVVEQLPKLRAAGLTDASWLAKADVGEIVVRMTESGHDRGYFVGWLADRIHRAMEEIEAGVLDSLPDLLSKGDEDEAIALLSSVHGIGLHVARNALRLMSQG